MLKHTGTAITDVATTGRTPYIAIAIHAIRITDHTTDRITGRTTVRITGILIAPITYGLTTAAFTTVDRVFRLASASEGCQSDNRPVAEKRLRAYQACATRRAAANHQSTVAKRIAAICQKSRGQSPLCLQSLLVAVSLIVVKRSRTETCISQRIVTGPNR